MSKQKNKNSKNGFAAFYLTVLILAVILAISVSISILTFGQQKISQNITKSSQAYYTSEAGVEDALLRLVKKMNWSSPYNLKVGNATATVEISDVISGSRTITSTGNSLNRIRKIQVGYAISNQQVSFHYATQVGDGGIEMKNNSRIIGNVFSNGSILAQDLASASGTTIVARNGNKISGLIVKEDAKVDICENSNIEKTLTCATNNGCTALNSEVLTGEITPRDMPISSSTIQGWKDEAASGGVISSLNLSGSQVLKLGPKKIEGDLLIENQAKLTMTGTIWVTGNIHLKNNSILELDSEYAGSGVIIADGSILLENNVISRGSGQEGSYLMLLSTNSSLDPSNPAIKMQNNAKVDVIYTSDGLIQLLNNADLRSICAYKLLLENNVTLTYEVGLEDTSFSSGPGGGWEVTSWKEIE